MNPRIRTHGLSLLVLMSALGASNPAAAIDHNATLTVGSLTTGLGCAAGLGQLSGHYYFNGSISVGSYSPTSLGGGKTIQAIADLENAACSIAQATVKISGFTANPGRSWLTSVTCNGVTMFSGLAVWDFSGGNASWTWNQTFGFSSFVGSNVSCTISLP